MIKTVVFQSYRTSDVPNWISECLRSVEWWAESKGFDYLFFDDVMFDYAPKWYRDAVDGNILLISDLARLVIASSLLERNFDRVVWVDADVIVFDPEHFNLDIETQYAFCHEVWVEHGKGEEVRCVEKVNNAVCVFVRENNFLDFYIYACKEIVKQRAGKLSPISVGTKFLTTIFQEIRFPLLKNVGLFSPLVTKDLALNHKFYPQTYIKAFGHEVRAANLCSSLRDKAQYKSGTIVTDTDYQAAINTLTITKGNVINQFISEMRND
jgi:hypothetical protein